MRPNWSVIGGSAGEYTSRSTCGWMCVVRFILIPIHPAIMRRSGADADISIRTVPACYLIPILLNVGTQAKRKVCVNQI